MASGLPNDINARHHQSFQYVGSVVAQRVGVFNSLGAQVDTFGGASAAVYVDDADWTALSSSHTLIGGIYQSTPGTITDGDTGPLRVDANGHLQVDVLSGGGSGTEYTEDAATPNPILGTATMLERDDALSTVTPAEGDWIGMRGTAEGALWVQDFNSDAILADTAAMDTNLATLAGAVSGTEMQVDIVSGGGGTAYTEDVATANPIVGTATLIERDDVLTTAVAEGDWLGLKGSAEGALWVQDFNSDAILADTAAIQTAVEIIDNAVHVDDAAFTLGTDSGMMMMGFAGAQSVNSNDAAALACTTAGALHVNILAQTNDVTIADGGNSITVDNGGTFATQVDGAALTALQLIDNIVVVEDTASAGGASGALAMAVRNDTPAAETGTDSDYSTLQTSPEGALWVSMATKLDNVNDSILVYGNTAKDGSGTDYVPLLDADGHSQVDVLTMPSVAVTNAGTFAAQAVAAGDVAHDAADSGNPVKIGMKAKAFDGTPAGTDAAENDRVDAIATVEGIQYVNTVHPNHWSVSVDYGAAQTNATVKAAPGAGLKLYVTGIYCSNGAVAGNITLLDGSGGTVVWETYPAINGGGVLPSGMVIPLTANTLLAITSTTVTTHTLTVQGYIAA
jgi:hypothetical protein